VRRLRRPPDAAREVRLRASDTRRHSVEREPLPRRDVPGTKAGRVLTWAGPTLRQNLSERRELGMERQQEDEQPTPGPEEDSDERTQEDAGLPGGGAATTPSDSDEAQ
jgi:hypothetical protein